VADFIVLGLVLFLLMPLKGRKFLRKGPAARRPFLFVIWLAQQLRQLGDIRRDSSSGHI
jgi:hypothetical protein